MKIALPTNSTRFISGEVAGISLLSASPARNDPMIASSPASWARKAPRKTIASTKIYCEMLSCTLLKNQRPIRGESQQNEEREGRDRQPQPHPEHVVGVTRRERDDDRQHQQRERIGNHCSAHGDADRIVLADSQLADNGVGDQRVRSEHAGQQYRSEPRKAEQVVSRDDTERHRHAEGIETESQAAQAVAFEIAHIDFQSRQEHDVEQPRRARKDDAAVAQDEVEAVGADHGSGDDEPQ